MRVEASDEIRQPRVFLSYARADRGRVAKLAEALTAAGLAVWWDTAIETGSQFSEDIERELDAADVVVVVWSAASVKSTWVRDEAGHGRDRGRLVPVQIDGTLPPLGFRQFQSTDLSDWKGRASDPKIGGLVAAIRKLAGEAPQPGTAAVAVPAATGPSRRALIGGAAAVAALAAGGVGAWKLWGGKADDGTASVVVLPFANLSGDPAQAFFSDGIAEELRSALSRIPGLKVIGRVSSERFRDADDLPAVANQLGVDHVLTGSVRRSPTTIRIGAQLVDGKSGVESWSQSFDQPIGDSLVIQSKIATSVVAALSPKLAKATGTIVVGGTSNPQAQELLLKGRRQFQTDPSEANIRQYLAFLDAAIALDFNYADAWAAKGFMHDHLRSYSASAAERAILQNKSMAASQRAVELAPSFGFARISLAVRYLNRLQIGRALSEAGKGIASAPADALVLGNATLVVRAADPGQAVATAKRAIELDPFNPAYFDYYSGSLMAARQFKDAAQAAREAASLSNNLRGHHGLVLARLALGEIDAARASLPSISDPSLSLPLKAIVEARASNRAPSDAALEAIRQRDTESRSYALAQVHAGRGERDAALGALEIALARKESGLSLVAVDFLLDPIRREPRFKAVQDAVIPPDLFVPPRGA